MARASLGVIATILLSLFGVVTCGDSFRRVSVREPDGETDAQLAYDAAESKVRAAETTVAAAQESERYEQMLMDAASKQVDDASAIYNASAEAQSKAYKELAAAMDALKNTAGDAGIPDSIVADLDKETEDYAECKALDLSRTHKVEDLRQKEEKLESAEKSAAVEEELKREAEESAKPEAAKAEDAEKAEEALFQARRVSSEAGVRSLITTAAGTGAVATSAPEEPTDAEVARLQPLYEALAEVDAQAKAAVDAKKEELARTQEAIDAATEVYHKLQAETAVLESLLKDAPDDLPENTEHGEVSDEESDENSAFRFSSHGLLSVVILAARLLS